MRVLFSSLVLALLVFSGCMSEPKKSKYEQPSWVMKPNQGGSTGAVGTAYRHHKGLSHQRKLAITRALDELSLQKGVKVSISMNKQEHVKNDKSTSELDVESKYSSSNTVTAHIEEIWQDPLSQEFFVWMVID